MATTRYISITQLCEGYQIERNYVLSLQDFGLIEFKLHKDEPHIESIELPKLEKIISFHQELNINFEGIEVIFRLLEKVERLTSDVGTLRRRLYLLEDGEPIE